MAPLVDQLVRHILRDNAIIFVGSNLLSDGRGQSLLQQLAEQLAQEIDYQGANREFPAVAQEFQVVRGRNELIRALRESLATVEETAADLYRLLAAAVAPYTKIITTRFDRAVEDALREIDRIYIPIVTDADVPAFDESLIALIKLRGDIFYQYTTERDGLILTEDDFEAFFSSLPAINDVVRAFFATKTLIFIGYELDDPTFRRFFLQVTHNLGVFSRTAYALVPHDLPPRKVEYWRQHNVEVHTNVDLRQFLQELATAVQAQPLEPGQKPQLVDNPLAALADPPRPDHPYKALDSFTGADVAIFAGRQDESRRLTNRILGHRLVVLYGESGSGKTSLLHAGAGPLLAQQRVLLASGVPTPGQSLAATLRDGLRAAGERARLPRPAADDLPTLLRTWQRALDGAVVLAVDQFEQMFIAYDDAERETAVRFLQELRTIPELDLRLVFVIREDFLGRLQTLAAELPELMSGSFRLDRLGREEARAAIEKPAARFGVSWSVDVVEQILDDLQGETGVAPPQLQIVCARLYDAVAARDNGPHARQITRADLEAQGGTAAILGDYVEGVVAQLPPAQQGTARLLLGALVNSALVKQRLSLAELARVAQVDEAVAATILDELTQQRLLRRYARDGGDGRLEYELIHDSLVFRIVAWLGDAFWDAQRARERLRAAVKEWQERHNLLTPGDLRLVAGQRGYINMTPAETAVAYAAAVAYDEDPAAWRADLPRDAARDVLRALATGPEAFVRARALAHLAASPEDAATLVDHALHDADAAVREAATLALAQHPQETAVQQLAATADDPATAAAALHLLATMRDRETAVGGWLPDAWRRPVVQRVLSERWQRHRQQILLFTGRGAVGGAIAAGLGIGLGGGLSTFDFATFSQLFQANGLTVVPSAARELFTLTGPLAVGGALALGISAFVLATLCYLLDPEHEVVALAVGVATTAVTFGCGLAFFSSFGAGASTADLSGNFLAGLVSGGVLAGAVVVLRRRPWWQRLGLVTVVALLIFLAINALPLSFDDLQLWIIVVMSLLTALGFDYAFSWKAERPFIRPPVSD